MFGLGLVAGVLGGLLGIGGGTLVVPGLVIFFGFNQHRAHGTSLLIALILAASGVFTYYRHGDVNLVIAFEIAVGGVIGAVIGARVANLMRGKMLRKVFSIFLVVIGIRMAIAGLHTGAAAHKAAPLFMNDAILGALTVIGVGLLTGFMSALLGIGGGLVMVPALTILLCVPQKMAHGISLAAMMPTAFTGMLMHRAKGNVDFTVGKWVGLGSALGAISGATLAVNLDASILKIIFGVFLILMAVLMAIKK